MEKARLAKAEAARKRSEATERQQLAEIEAVWDSIPEETRRAFDYIKREIASGSRDANEVAFLRETRAIHFAPYKRMVKKEA